MGWNQWSWWIPSNSGCFVILWLNNTSWRPVVSLYSIFIFVIGSSHGHIWWCTLRTSIGIGIQPIVFNKTYSKNSWIIKKLLWDYQTNLRNVRGLQFRFKILSVCLKLGLKVRGFGFLFGLFCCPETSYYFCGSSTLQLFMGITAFSRIELKNERRPSWRGN